MNSRILPFLIYLAILSTITTLKAEIDWKTWYDERTKEYEAALLLPDQEKIRILGQMLRPADPLGLVPKNSFQQDHYLRAQSTLLSIPGHAEYFGKKLTDAHQRYKNNPRDPVENAISKYSNELFYSTSPLRNLPSPETVRVLGEMLADEWVDEKNPNWDRPPSLALVGAGGLSNLPIQNKPYPFRVGKSRVISGSQIEESLPHWQKWYQQVKEGRRTFSFEGDPNEYDLNGITREAKNPDIPRAAKRPSITNSASPESGKPSKPVTVPWVAGAIAVILAGASWIVLKRRKAI